MTIQNFAGRYFATERDRTNGGGFVGTGRTALEAIIMCLSLMNKS